MILFNNYPLVAAFAAIVISQIVKVPVALLLKRPSSVALATSTGGMPSSHSAGVTALITSMIAEYGIQSPYVAIASTFGVIVMFDSMGVRRQSGEHGILINELLADFENLRKTFTQYNHEDIQALEEEERHSREHLGHKPIEVVFGMLSGIIISLIIGIFY